MEEILLQRKFLGIQEVDFTNKDTGEIIRGVSLHTAFKEDGISGLAVRKFFIRDGSIALPKDIQVNEVLDLGFNYKGRIESIRRIKE